MPLPSTSTYKSPAFSFPEYRGRRRFRERELPLKNKLEKMAEDFQAGICGGNSWNFLRSVLAGGSSPCLSGYNDIGSYGWSATELNSVSDSFLNFPGLQRASGGSLLMESDGLMMGFDLSSSPTSDWNQTVLSRGNGRTDSNLNSLFQEHTAPEGNRRHEEPIGFDDHRSSRIRNDGSPNNFSTITDEDNSIDHSLKPADRDFYPDQGGLNSDICSGNSRMFSAAFPVGSTSYGYHSPLMLQTLSNSRNQQSSSLTCNVNRSINSLTSGNYGLICEDLSLSWPKLPSTSSHTKPLIQQQQNGGFHFSNNTPYWNSSSSSSPSSQPQLIASFFAEKPKCHNLTTKKLQLYTGEDVQEWGSVTKRSNGGGTDSVIKRPRIETPSPLPTFKVRKEKLGDRITALQQLVSPFGKTDTASVLHEAIEYIKFLHDQVSVLSTPYMKSGASIHHQEISEKYPQSNEAKQELRNRGLCLVPISSTFAVANETTPEFWTPTFGGTFK